MSGIITQPQFRSYFENPPPSEIGTMVAVLEIGAFVTSLACGTLADIFGRKTVLFWGALIFSIGGAIQTFTTGFTIMVVGRIVAGLGVGVMSMVVPIYQSEISPAENRGRLACIEFTGNIIGYASSVWIDYMFSFLKTDLSWRLPLSFQVIVGMTLCLGSIMLPESPRWLVDNDRDTEAMRVLADLHGNGDARNRKARREYREIKTNVIVVREEEREKGRGYGEMWRRYKKRTLIACSSQMCAQLNGINVISYYAPNVFLAAGWIGRDAILMAGINAIFYVLSSIPPWYLVDAWGRRPILLSGAVFGALSLFATAGFLFLDTTYTANAVVVCVILFNASHGYSFGPIPWLYPPEIMPLSFRAKGASLSTATNWFFNWCVGELTPILMDSIGYRLYMMHGGFCIFSFILVYFTYPETKGVALEEMEVVFGDAQPREIVDDSDDQDEDDDDGGDISGRTAGGGALPINIAGTNDSGGERASSRGPERPDMEQTAAYQGAGAEGAGVNAPPTQNPATTTSSAAAGFSRFIPSWVPLMGGGRREPSAAYEPLLTNPSETSRDSMTQER